MPGSGPLRVFLSYSRKDETVANHVRRVARDAGQDVWIDSYDIRAGDGWRASIVSGIEQADVVLVVLSKHSVGSEHVATEVQIARELGRRVVPVKLGTARLSGALLYSLAGVQVVDCSSDRMNCLTEVVQTLESVKVRDARTVPENGRGRYRWLGVVGIATLAAVAGLAWVATRDSTSASPSAGTLGVSSTQSPPAPSSLITSESSGGSDDAAAASGSTIQSTSQAATLPMSDSTAPSTTLSDDLSPMSGESSPSDVQQPSFRSPLADFGFVTVPPRGIQPTADSVGPPDARGLINYGPDNLIDQNLETAWQEETDGLGVGTRLRFQFVQPQMVDVVDVYPGWQTSFPCRFEKNGRPSEVLIEATQADGKQVEARTESVEGNAPFGLLRTQLPTQVAYASVEIEVIDVQEGTSCDRGGPSQDLLISEVVFAAWPGVECGEDTYDPFNDGWPDGVEPIIQQTEGPLPGTC